MRRENVVGLLLEPGDQRQQQLIVGDHAHAMDVAGRDEHHPFGIEVRQQGRAAS